MKGKEKKYDVLVVGELNVDLILSDIGSFPEIGKEVFSKDMILTLGSSSAILANNLSIWGVNVAFLGKLGKDSYSDLVLGTLNRSGVNTDHIIISENSKTGITVAFSYGDDRAMVTYPGAMSELKESDVKDEVLKKARHLHVSSVFMQESLKPDIIKLFKRAKNFGLTTSLDTQWDPFEKWDLDYRNLLPYVDVFLPNETELMNLVKTGSVKEAIEKIRDFSNIVVVKQSVKGSELFSKEETIFQTAFLNENVVDAIGAGDSFNAGFLKEYLKKSDLKKCMEQGAVSGAVNTTGPGGTGAFQNMKEVHDMAAKILNNSKQE